MSLSFSNDGALTGISSKIDTWKFGFQGGVSKGSWYDEFTLKNGDSFNSLKLSYTPTPKDFPPIKPLPLPLPLPFPIKF